MSPGPRGGSELTRRAVVAGSGIVAVSAAMAACSGYGDQGAAPASSPPVTASGSAEPPSGGSNSSAGAPKGEKIAAASDIPVGGGLVLPDQKVVVTQPSPGTFKAFSAVCTHQGCTVNQVAEGTIACPCHGSKYAIADGSVVRGPAQRPLAARQVAVSGNDVLLQS